MLALAYFEEESLDIDDLSSYFSELGFLLADTLFSLLVYFYFSFLSLLVFKLFSLVSLEFFLSYYLLLSLLLLEGFS